MNATTSSSARQPATFAGAAPVSQAVLGQTRAELTMTLRRGESVLVTIVMPVLFLVFFGSILPVPKVAGKAINFLLPGIIAVAIISTGMVSLGIATAYERYYGVLKRLGSSPLPRWGLIAAKLVSVLALEIVQVILLVGIAVLFFGWRPAAGTWAAVPIALLGTLVFAGLGMLMAGGLRAEATLAGANGLYVVFLAIGGIFVPTDHFPGPVAAICNVLPPAALSDALRGALTNQGVHAGSVILLMVWAAIILVAAARLFKWE
ncbi:MAG TPA: ABC transporter permease [Ktedonobacterales bacterium]|nr:ABC transporter permease [Ktedonobacterales bacterium]